MDSMQNEKQPLESNKNSNKRATIFAACTLYFIAAVGLYQSSWIVSFIVYLFPNMGGDMAFYWSTPLFEIGLLALPPILYAMRRKGIIQGMRLNGLKFSSIVTITLAAIASIVLSQLLAQLWFVVLELLGATPSSESLVPIPSSIPHLILIILQVGVVAAVCEELLFRGILLPAFERKGTISGIVISGLLFAILHGSVEALPIHILMGLVLGYIVCIYDSLFAGMLFHLLYNSGLIVLGYLQMKGSESSIYEMLDKIGEGMTMTERLLLSNAFPSLLFATGMFFLALFLLLNMPLRMLHLKGDTLRKIHLVDKEPIALPTLTILCSAIVTCTINYIVNILRLYGII